MAQIQLHPFQTRAYLSDKRFVALISGTGSGKTFFCPIWLSQEIQKNPQGNFLAVSPTVKMLQRTLIPAFINCYKDSVFEGVLKEQKGQYILPQGGVIYFSSADCPDFIEGLHASAAVLDEASLMSRHLWVIAQSRVGKNMGRILISTSPRGFNWIYDFYKKYLEGDPDYDVIQFRSIDSPYYPKKEFERAQKTLDSRTFEMRYCGKFVKFSGLVYPDFGLDNIIDNCNTQFSEVRAGVDWGFTGACCILCIGIDPSGNPYVIDEWYEKGKLLNDVVYQATLLQNRYKISTFFCDPSLPSHIQTFQLAGLNAVAADNKIQPGIQDVAMLIKAKSLKIMSTCKNLLDEIAVYHYPEGSLKDIPVKEQDHGCDALRYCIRGTGEVEEIEEEIIITGEDIGLERVKIGEDY
jgi:PBSX family phage terminase large subunit